MKNMGFIKPDSETRKDLRCECGCLVAKLIGANIELKCRRCKRLALIPLTDFEGGLKTVPVRL